MYSAKERIEGSAVEVLLLSVTEQGRFTIAERKLRVAWNTTGRYLTEFRLYHRFETSSIRITGMKEIVQLSTRWANNWSRWAEQVHPYWAENRICYHYQWASAGKREQVRVENQRRRIHSQWRLTWHHSFLVASEGYLLLAIYSEQSFKTRTCSGEDLTYCRRISTDPRWSSVWDSFDWRISSSLNEWCQWPCASLTSVYAEWIPLQQKVSSSQLFFWTLETFLTVAIPRCCIIQRSIQTHRIVR